jgi:hypothetical protein
MERTIMTIALIALLSASVTLAYTLQRERRRRRYRGALVDSFRSAYDWLDRYSEGMSYEECNEMLSIFEKPEYKR